MIRKSLFLKFNLLLLALSLAFSLPARALDEISLLDLEPGERVIFESRSSDCFTSNTSLVEVTKKDDTFRVSINAESSAESKIEIKDQLVYKPDIAWLDAALEEERKLRGQPCDISSTSGGSVSIRRESETRPIKGERLIYSPCLVRELADGSVTPFGTRLTSSSALAEFERHYLPTRYRSAVNSIRSWSVDQKWGGRLGESLENWLRRVAGLSAVITWNLDQGRSDYFAPSPGGGKTQVRIRGLARWDGNKSLAVTQAVTVDARTMVPTNLQAVSKKDLAPEILIELDLGEGLARVVTLKQAEDLVNLSKLRVTAP